MNYAQTKLKGLPEHVKQAVYNGFVKRAEEIDDYLKPMGDPARNRWLFNGNDDLSHRYGSSYFLEKNYFNKLKLDRGMGNNSLIVNAHGGGGPGEFHFQVDPNAVVNNDIKNEISNFLTDGRPTFDLMAIARKMGPATNNIHNFYSGACNRDGGLTPQDIQKYFPNVTNVNITPPGSLGRKVEAIGQSAKDMNSVYNDVNKQEPSFINTFLGKPIVPNSAPPSHYSLQGTNWINHGSILNANSGVNIFNKHMVIGADRDGNVPIPKPRLTTGLLHSTTEQK